MTSESPTPAADPSAVATPPVTTEPPGPAGPPPAGYATYAAPAPGRTSAPVGWVIAAMLLFWPTGIPALLASHRAARAFGAGDVPAAVHESANAKRWSIISVVVGAILVVGSLLMTIAWAFVVAVAVHDHGYDRWERGPGFDHQQPFLGPDRRSSRSSDG